MTHDEYNAFCAALESAPARGHVINIGSGRSYAIAEVAMMLARAMDVSEIEPEVLGRARSGDVRNCFSDIGKAQNLLGYEATNPLEDSLEEMVEWIRASVAIDRTGEMRRELESLGLVS